MRSIGTIFEEFGGPANLGRALGISTEHAVQMRRRKSIPIRWWPKLIEASIAANRALTESDLVAAHIDAENARIERQQQADPSAVSEKHISDAGPVARHTLPVDASGLSAASEPVPGDSGLGGVAHRVGDGSPLAPPSPGRGTHRAADLNSIHVSHARPVTRAV